MDSKVKFRVLNSNTIESLGIITELENVSNGIPENGVLKSVMSNLFWEVKNRIIEFNSEKRFECEKELNTHINTKNRSIDLSSIIQQREEKNIRLYSIKPIGHNSKPKINEDLVFHATTFRNKIKIVGVYENYFLLEDKENNYKAVIPKRKVVRAKTAEVGDFVRHCEHQYHDLVDINEAFIYREI
jgi:hypothetical protein